MPCCLADDFGIDAGTRSKCCAFVHSVTTGTSIGVMPSPKPHSPITITQNWADTVCEGKSGRELEHLNGCYEGKTTHDDTNEDTLWKDVLLRFSPNHTGISVRRDDSTSTAC